MANTLKFGNGQWATGNGTALAYNDENANFKPLPFDFTRASSGTTVNQSGLIETVGSGIPRIDFQGNTKGALLLEPSRTNSITYSEDFSTGFGWSQSGIATVTSGYLSPDGSLNAYKLSNANGTVRTGNVIVRNFGAGNYTFSLYVKSLGSTKIKFYFRDGSTGNIVDSGSLSLTSEYKRLTFSHNVLNTSNFYIGDTDGDVIIYGAQLELGSYATSYIPTSGSAVTRVADSCSQTLPNAVFNSYPFSVFAEVDIDDINNGFAFSLLNKSSTNNYFTAEYYSNQWHIVARPSGTSIIISSSATPTKGTHKIVGVYTDTDLKLYLNGSLIASGSNSLPFNTNIDSLLLGQLRTVTDTGTRNSTRQVLLYNTELTNAEAIALTQV